MNSRRKMMKLRKGFTLIELLVVVAIIGILTTIAVPKFMAMTEGSKKATLEANHRIIVSAISMYIAANDGAVPSQGSDLDPYLSGGFTGVAKYPKTATYVLTPVAATPTTPASIQLVSTLGATVLTYQP
jgi:prepilin-type N-terminal cleavage/methylation domain-containing protein